VALNLWTTSDAPAQEPSESTGARPALQLVQSCPVETGLCHPRLPLAHEAWLELIESAERRLDLAHFYFSNADSALRAADPQAGRLEHVIRAIESAARRGAQVRILAEQGFHETYPETLDRLSAQASIEVRLYDVRARMGGVLHLKMLLVDENQAYIGSQNFDWRALEHIQELGVRIEEPALSRSLRELFETDWALADPQTPDDYRFVFEDGRPGPLRVQLPFGTVEAAVVYSPRDWLPRPSQWDLPRLLDMIEESERSVRVQLLSYTPDGRDGYWPALDQALRAAAARGVQVQLLLSHWETRPGRIEWLQSLQSVPNLEVRLVWVPEWSGGFIPYARVVHAKYMVVDGRRAWLGTSNWSRDYFFQSRNVGLVFEGEAIARTLEEFFELGWQMEFSRRVDPCAKYPRPRIGE